MEEFERRYAEARAADPQALEQVEARLVAVLEGWPHRRWPTARQWREQLGAGGLYERAAQLLPHSVWALHLGFEPVRPGQRAEPRQQWTDERIRLALLELYDQRAQLGLDPWPGFGEWQAHHDINLYWACAHSRPGGVRWWKQQTRQARLEAQRRAAGADASDR